MDFWRIVAAILLPPLGVFLQVGFSKHFWINILLTILGYIPGLVHAVWVIAKYCKAIRCAPGCIGQMNFRQIEFPDTGCQEEVFSDTRRHEGTKRASQRNPTGDRNF